MRREALGVRREARGVVCSGRGRDSFGPSKSSIFAAVAKIDNVKFDETKRTKKTNKRKRVLSLVYQYHI